MLVLSALPFWVLPLALVAAAALILVGVATFYATHFQKSGPNEVLIVSGRRATYIDPDTGASIVKNFAIYHGGGTFILPIRERADRMSVELMTLEILTPEFFTKFGIPIVVDAIAQIKVSSDDPLRIATAAEMFLSKSTAEMNQIAHQMMQGHLRAVISTLPFEEIHATPEAFAQSVQRLTAADLDNMGIQVVSFTIREVLDPSGYLQALGRPQLAEVNKNAILGEAHARRDADIGTAEATRLSTVDACQAREQSEMAEIEVAKHIAEANAVREQRDLELQAAVAAAQVRVNAAPSLEQAKIELELLESRRRVSRLEREERIELERLETTRIEEELKHTVTSPALAEAERVQTAARAANAEALLRIETEVAEQRALGEVEIALIRGRAEAEAEATRLRGQAHADSVRAAQLAEAEGMAAKAEAWKQYGQAAISQLYIERLPELAAAVAAPLAKIDRIVMVNQGGEGEQSVGFQRITQGVNEVIAHLPGMLQTLGALNLPEMVAKGSEVVRAASEDEAAR